MLTAIGVFILAICLPHFLEESSGTDCNCDEPENKINY